MEIKWKQIENYPKYEVSELGEIKNNKGLILTPLVMNGYYKVNLYNQYGSKSFFIHRLVAIAFIPNYTGFKQVNHVDDDKTNNSVDNLYWGTQSQNLLDCYKNGFKSIKCKKVNQMKNNEVIQTYESIREASKATSIHESSISNVVCGLARTAGGFSWNFVQEKGGNFGS